MKSLIGVALFGALGLVAGCSGGSDSATGSGSAALTGSWDLTGTASPGDNGETGILTMNASTFSITIGGGSLVYQANGNDLTVTYSEGRYDSGSAPGTRAPAPSSWGWIPLALGGTTTFRDANDADKNCVITTTNGSMSFQCNDADPPWPDHLPDPDRGVLYRMTRNEPAPATSSFGDLGGTWTLSSSRGDSTSGCTMTFGVGKITASCPSNVHDLGGSFDATFTETSVSGTTSAGLQFAGRKR